MKRIKVIKEILLNLIITVGISLSLFLVNKYFSLYLGIQNLGLMKLFTQLLAYLNLAEIGLSSASTYALYKPLAEKDYNQISVIINTIASLYKKISLFILIVGLLLNPIIPFFIKDKLKDVNIYLYWSLYVINTALSYSFAKYSVLFTADQKFKFVRLIQGESRIFCQILQIIIIIKFESFLIFILLLILDNIIQFIFYKIHYKKYYFNIFKTKITDKSITKNLKNLFWHKLAGLIVFNTDLILISKFISLEVVGIYASYQMIVQMIITLINIILSVLRPKIGKFIAENNKEEIFNCWRNLNIIFLNISILFSFCAYILIDDFIKLWIGNKYILPKQTTILIIINLFVQCFRGVTDVFKDGSGFFDDIQLPIIEAILNFVFSIVLLYYIGLNGVIVGTIISNILIISIARPVLVFIKCFNKDWKDYIEVYGNYLILLILSLFGLNLIIKSFIIFEINGWIEWIIYAIKISSISGIIIFIVFLLNKEFRNILKKIL
ncbi:oligosaccharide flippase family protein [Fusobacterium sp. SYSU M8D902]|uniref:lipopolysaccharide biosynthesis protein n=1 Tax=Fusobacterium sp. SYSU M8D902 TaxID=3159562 RepID=UPI0032E3F0B9